MEDENLLDFDEAFKNRNNPIIRKELDSYLKDTYLTISTLLNDNSLDLDNFTSELDQLTWNYYIDKLMEEIEFDEENNCLIAPSVYHAALYLRRINQNHNSKGGSLMFRGQADSSYNLVPSYYREGLDVNKETYAINLFINILFYSNYGNFKNYTTSSEVHMATAQHYGLKTKYLDVTLDPFVALSFANGYWQNERKSSLASVYLFNVDDYSNELKVVLPPAYCSNLYNQSGLFIDFDQLDYIGFSNSSIFSIKFPYDNTFNNELEITRKEDDKWLYNLAEWCRENALNLDLKFPLQLEKINDVINKFEEFLKNKNILSYLLISNNKTHFDNLIKKTIKLSMSFAGSNFPFSFNENSEDRLKQLIKHNSSLLFAISSYVKFTQSKIFIEYRDFIDYLYKLTMRQIVSDKKYNIELNNNPDLGIDVVSDMLCKESILNIIKQKKESEPDIPITILTDENFNNSILKFNSINNSSEELNNINLIDSNGLLSLIKSILGEEDFKKWLDDPSKFNNL